MKQRFSFARVGTAWVMALAVAAGGCGGAPEPEEPTPESRWPVIRLLSIDPEPGARVGPETVLHAVIAYHIPGFREGESYRLTPTFAGRTGGTFNRDRGDPAVLTSPAGVVTIDYPLRRLLTEGRRQLARPITGAFFLLDSGSAEGAADTTLVDGRTVVRLTRRSRVAARTRSFFYNGGGPARSMADALIDALAEYHDFLPHKAMATGHADGRSVWGNAFGYDTPEAAAERALEECRNAAVRRGLEAECRLRLVDDESVGGAPSGG